MSSIEKKKAERKARRLKTCIFFNGIINRSCQIGVVYDEIKPIPCLGEETRNCPSYRPYTEDEIEAEDAESDRQMKLIAQGISPCCEAPIDDKTLVIKEGNYKGHGRYLCSNCKKIVMIV